MAHPVLWILVVAAAVVTAAAGWLLRRWHQAARRRIRERRVRAELEELGVEDVVVQLDQEGTRRTQDLGPARLALKGEVLAPRGTGFFLAPAGPDSWSTATGRRILLRFARDGVRHEVRCRVAGKGRLTPGGRRRLGVKGRVVFRAVAAGVIVKRERRDMMRFYVGDARAVPDGTTDVRHYVELQARLQSTDLDTSGGSRLRPRLRADAFRIAAAAPSPDGTSTPGCPVDVLDFSGTGLRVEADLSTVSELLQLGDDEDAAEVLDRLGERALLVTVAPQFQFPSSVEDLEPSVPPRIWLLAEAARVSLLEGAGDATQSRVRIGLAFLYQVLKVDAASGLPQRWVLIRKHGEADDFVAIHSALNQARARMESGSAVGAG